MPRLERVNCLSGAKPPLPPVRQVNGAGARAGGAGLPDLSALSSRSVPSCESWAMPVPTAQMQPGARRRRPQG